MTRTLAMLMAITLAACGSASTAGHKTSNPPLKTAPPKADPAAKPPVEVDGLTIKFNALGFSLTFPNAEWGGEAKPGADGQVYLVFERTGSNLRVVMAPLVVAGTDPKALIGSYQTAFMGDPSYTVGPLEEETGDRWRFTLEGKANDGTPFRGRMSAQPITGRPDNYLLAVAMAPGTEYDKYLAEVKSILDSLKALR